MTDLADVVCIPESGANLGPMSTKYSQNLSAIVFGSLIVSLFTYLKYLKYLKCHFYLIFDQLFCYIFAMFS